MHLSMTDIENFSRIKLIFCKNKNMLKSTSSDGDLFDIYGIAKWNQSEQNE
jgi:hypothetical protein